jgi:hypothetical protein
MNSNVSAAAAPAGIAVVRRGRRRAGGRARRPVRELLVAATVLLTVIGAAGIALAYWQAGGTGTGTATTGTATAVTLSPGAPAVTLYPGGQSDVTLTVSNPNTTAVTIAALALDTAQGTGGFAVDAGHFGCAVSALSLSLQTNAGAGWTVPAKTGTVNGALAITLPNALAMATGAANACQGAQFTVYLAAGS